VRLATSPNCGNPQAMKACRLTPSGLVTAVSISPTVKCWGRKDAVVERCRDLESSWEAFWAEWSDVSKRFRAVGPAVESFAWGSEQVLQGWILPWPTNRLRVPPSWLK
jgi:hypothetical protein